MVRIGALLLLCGLVWYFSYDHGQTNAKNRVNRLELENISLREKLLLAEADLKVVKEQLAKAEAKAEADKCVDDQITFPEDPSGAGNTLVQDEANQLQVKTGLDQAGQAQVIQSQPSQPQTSQTQTSQPQTSQAKPGDGESDQLVPRPVDDQSRGRLTLRNNENKAAFGDRAVLTLVNMNSIDLEVTVRIRHVDSGRREAHIMNLGDLVEFELQGQKHSLYLDQIKGSLAMFILDGLPKAPAAE
jgi:hypothetical protein